jgi:two-component system, OmpR family, phosphate regulon response regulator PhoB
MTARGSAVERQRGLALGADGFIQKPFAMQDLRREVSRLLPV